MLMIIFLRGFEPFSLRKVWQHCSQREQRRKTHLISCLNMQERCNKNARERETIKKRGGGGGRRVRSHQVSDEEEEMTFFRGGMGAQILLFTTVIKTEPQFGERQKQKQIIGGFFSDWRHLLLFLFLQ